MDPFTALLGALLSFGQPTDFDCKPPFYRGCNMEQPDVRNDPGPSYAVPQEQPPAVEPDPEPEDPDKGHGNDPDGNDGDNPGNSEGPGGDRC